MVDHLEQKGARCFLAERDTQPGEAPSAASDAAIQSSATVVVVLTDSAANSLEVARELEHADRCSVPVVAVKVDAAEPTERLSRVLSDPHWVESSREPAAVDLEAIERAVRSHVPVLTPKSGDEESGAAEPLLTEFSPKLLPGRPGTRQVTLAAFFTTWALLTCFLSVLGNAGYITVMLQGPQTARPVAVRFGYLYELNAALTYLIVVPCFIYFAVGFVQKAQAAVVKLARRNQLMANVAQGDNRSAVPLVGEANRRWMNKWLLALTCIVAFLVIVGTEYLPPKSDYKHVMFGYVQAPWIADYASVCPNCTLSQLAQRTGRELEPIGGLNVDQLKDYRIVPPFYTRSHTAIERIGFGLFMISALGLQVSVTVFVAWAVLKAGFFLKLIYDALIADKRSRVKLSLRYTDPAGMFGLETVHRALTQLVGLVGVSAVLEILSWWSNALKGSRRALGQDLYTLGGWGQFFVANFSVILAILLLVWLFNVSSITREAAGEEAKRISAAGAATEQDLEMLERQSIWRSPRYSVTYVAAPVVYVMSILMLNRLGIAYAVGDVWIAVLSHVLGRD